MSDAANEIPDVSLRIAFAAADRMSSTLMEMVQVAEGWSSDLFDADAALAGMCGGVKDLAFDLGRLRHALAVLRLAVPEGSAIDLPSSGAAK